MSDIEKALATLRLTKDSSVAKSINENVPVGNCTEPSNHNTNGNFEGTIFDTERAGSASQNGITSQSSDFLEQAANTPNGTLEQNVQIAKNDESNAVEPFLTATSTLGKHERNVSRNDEDETLNPLLELPLQKLLNAGFLVPNVPKGRLTEEYRRVKRPLLKNMRDNTHRENRNIVMVTSSVTGEGKTYTAINLAMSFALERNRTVLLIDGDVIKGSAGKVLGVSPDAIGFTDFLSGDCSNIRDAIFPTNVARLNFLPAGNEKNLANELLSSERMSVCISELAARYSDRIIIIDSPPILQTNEANVISDYAGQIVFVVAEADTPQKTVTQALAHIDKEKYVGILVNKSLSSGKSYSYGYDYGFR